MKLTLMSVLLAVSLAAPAFAQATKLDGLTPMLPTVGERRAADIASWVTSLTVVALDAHKTIGKCDGQDECYHAIVTTGLRVGATYGAVFAIKKLVQRVRPCSPACGRDKTDFSLPSGHTAIAFSTVGGPRLAFVLPLSIGTGGLRIAAGKHWLTDTLAGAGVGLLTSRIR